MKLYEALSTRSSLQNQLRQLISLRNRNLEYPEDEQPEFEFDYLTNQIKENVKTLSKLKFEIARANLDTLLPNQKTLFENIIELGNLRSTIDQIESLMQVERDFHYGVERRSKKEDIKMKRQKDASSLFAMLQEYRARKDALDSLIQQANHSVEITIS